MIGHRIWILFLGIASAGRALGFQCPEEQSCTCQLGHNGDFEIHCPTNYNSAFIVNVQPSEYIKVECRNSPNWTDFRLNNQQPVNHIKSIYFRMCDLPELSLGEIVRKLGIENGVEKLVFQSYDNLSTSLTRDHLQGFPELKKLILSSNSLSNLTDDLLADLPKLTWLDLRENNVELSSKFFRNTPHLEVLELGNNMMDSLKPGIFDELSELKLLNLWKNRLREIKSDTFDKLISLKSLDVNSNSLTELPRDVFKNLTNLETLNLFGNNFTSLPKDLFQNNGKLKTVNLYNNKRNLTTLPAGLLSNLTALITVKLKRNGLVSLPEDLFWGSTSLANVSMERNYISSLPGKIFRDSTKLAKLDLSFNDLESLPDEIFSYTNRLIKLNLSKNRITSISSDLFNGLNFLEELNMEDNRLSTIHDLSFKSLRRLRIARFSNNILSLSTSAARYQDEYGTRSPFHDSRSLEELYLAKNNISEIFSDWIVSHFKLRILDLKYNNISFITTEDLQFVSTNIKVDLTYNKIQHILLTSAEQLASVQEVSRDVIVLVENNPLVCDCYLHDFLRYLEGRMHPTVQRYFHIVPGNLTCQSPKWLENIAVENLKSKTLKCIVDGNSSVNAKCPDKCTCMVRPEDRAYLVDCTYKHLTQVPMDIQGPPEHHLELNFSGNALKHMPTLSNLDPQELFILSLSDNNISDISLAGLSTELKVLELHNNNVSRVDPTVLDYIKNSSSLTKLTLHGNPWKCDCDARDLLNFIQTKFVDLPDLLQVTCEGMDGAISEMTASEFCPVETAMIVGISMTIACTGLIVGAIAALYYRYQRQIKVWLYAHQWCLWFVTEDELDKDKLYDAFISYSHKDENFVVNELVSKLENGPRPFKLCLHFRDWLAGEWIPTQIARSVEDSRRTIVVLSPNFLESVWGRMEFRAAHSQALSEGRARVILILYGEIGPTDDLDPELKAYLSMNTYVKWGDPWFWDKLRYALPHPPELTKSALGKKIFEKHHPCIQINGDKKELIYPSGVPETPPAATTPPADSLKVFICDEDSRKETDVNESTKLNGSAKPIFVPDTELLKNSIININKIQCTTV